MKVIKYSFNKIKRLIDLVYNLIMFKFNNIKINFNDVKNIRGKVYLKNDGEIILGKNIKINSGKEYNAIGGDVRTILSTNPNAKIIIGNNTGISNSALISFGKIIIGNNVMIGGDCKIYDTDFHSLNIMKRLGVDNDIKIETVEIKDGCFIGAGSIILKGVIIGENSIIGAGSVVSKSVPSNEIWAGNPAKFIRKIKENDLDDAKY